MAIEDVLRRKRVLSTSTISEVSKIPSTFETFEEAATLAKSKGCVPRIIHKIWWQGLEKLPEKYKGPMESWASMNADWKIWVWDETAIMRMMNIYYPQYLQLFNNYPKMIQKIDAAKYFMLAQFGGCYSDMDQHCLNPLSNIVNPEDERSEMICSSLTEKKALILLSSSFRLRHGPYVNNAFIICKPKAKVWKHVFDELKIRQNHHFLIDEVKVVVTTGPVCFTRGIKRVIMEERKESMVVNSYNGKIYYDCARFVDSKTIDPFSIYFKMGKKDNFESILKHVVTSNEAVCISYEASSWTDGQGSWYSPVVKRLVHYLHKQDIKEITKMESIHSPTTGKDTDSVEGPASPYRMYKTYSWPKMHITSYRPTLKGRVRRVFAKATRSQSSSRCKSGSSV